MQTVTGGFCLQNRYVSPSTFTGNFPDIFIRIQVFTYLVTVVTVLEFQSAMILFKF